MEFLANEWLTNKADDQMKMIERIAKEFTLIYA